MKVGWYDAILRDQLRLRESIEKFLPEKQLATFMESQWASVIAGQNIFESMKKAVGPFEFREHVSNFITQVSGASPVFEDSRKLTQVPKLQIGQVAQALTARNLFVNYEPVWKDTLAPITDLIAKANTSMAEIASSLQVRGFADSLKGINSTWLDTGGISSAVIIKNDLLARISDIHPISTCVEEALQRLDQSLFSDPSCKMEHYRPVITESLWQMGTNYNALWEDLRYSQPPVSNLDFFVIQTPPVELYQATTLAGTFFPNVEGFRPSTKAEAALDDAVNGLEFHLRRLNARLLPLYRGAKSALKTSGPDSTRHFAVSLRELLTQILHLLSPDDDFDRWNSDSSLTDESRPTRKGRLLYICRNIKKGSFDKFVETDVDATVQFLKLFQEGAHAIEPSFTEEQLRAMLRRTEGLLSYLLDIGLKGRA